MATVTVRCSGETAGNIAAALPRLLKKEIRRAERENVKAAREELFVASSGGATPRDLARAGHPFARSRPGGGGEFDPAIINDPSGQFRAGWKAQEPTLSGNTISGSVTNDSPAAKWIATGGQGNSKMVARPIVQVVAGKIRLARKMRVRRGVTDAITGAIGKAR